MAVRVDVNTNIEKQFTYFVPFQEILAPQIYSAVTSGLCCCCLATVARENTLIAVVYGKLFMNSFVEILRLRYSTVSGCPIGSPKGCWKMEIRTPAEACKKCRISRGTN